MKDEEIVEWLQGLAESGKKIDYTLHEDDVGMLEEAVILIKRLKCEVRGLKMNEDLVSIHPDYLWAREISEGHGSGFESRGANKPLKVLFMYKKNKFQIFILNLILILKHWERKFEKWVEEKR